MATNQVIATMAQPLLVFGYQIKFEAIDPTDGSTVSGVQITDPNLSGINLAGTDETAPPTGPFMLVPGPES